MRVTNYKHTLTARNTNSATSFEADTYSNDEHHNPTHVSIYGQRSNGRIGWLGSLSLINGEISGNAFSSREEAVAAVKDSGMNIEFIMDCFEQSLRPTSFRRWGGVFWPHPNLKVEVEFLKGENPQAKHMILYQANSNVPVAYIYPNKQDRPMHAVSYFGGEHDVTAEVVQLLAEHGLTMVELWECTYLLPSGYWRWTADLGWIGTCNPPAYRRNGRVVKMGNGLYNELHSMFPMFPVDSMPGFRHSDVDSVYVFNPLISLDFDPAKHIGFSDDPARLSSGDAHRLNETHSAILRIYKGGEEITVYQTYAAGAQAWDRLTGVTA